MRIISMPIASASKSLSLDLSASLGVAPLHVEVLKGVQILSF